jgi:hypothetical protein
MPYTRAQLLAAYRQDHPGLASIDDNKLFAAIAVDSPEIAQGIDELHQPAYQSPRGDSAGMVASDQAASVLRGIPKVVTSLPQVPGMLFNAARGVGEALTGKGTERIGGLVEGAVEPLKTIGQGALELARPGTTNAPPPGDPRWTQAAEAAGTNLAGTLATQIPVKAGLNKVLDPHSLAGKAQKIRENMKGGTGINNIPTTKAGVVGAAVRGAANLVRRPVAAGLEKTARFLDSQYDVQPGLNLPEEDFVPQAADIDTSLQPRQVALAAEDEARRMAAPPMIEEPPLFAGPVPNRPQPYRAPMQAADDAAWLEQEQMAQVPEPFQMKPAASPVDDIVMDIPEDTIVAAEITPADISMVERGIAPSGNIRKASTIRNAPKLLEIAPELKGVPPGPRFDTGLVNAFRRAEAEITAAEGSVPRETMIPKKDIVTQIQAIEADLAMKNPSLVPAVSKVRGGLDKLPDMIPWEQFVETKRAMLREGRSASHSGMRRAYGALMDAAAKVSEPLSKANGRYHIIRKALTDANIDPSTGRRIGTVGTTVKPPLPAPPSKGRFTLPL